MARFTLENLNKVIGKRLIDIEHNQPEMSGSGVEELVLNFEGGDELLIFLDDEGNLHAEGD